MPVLEGKVRRSTFTSLKLKELSSVDRPAQAGAIAVIMKRCDDDLEGEDEMPKTVEELEIEVGKLTSQVDALTKAHDDAVAAKEAAEAERDEAQKALSEATDEVLKVDDETEVRKSDVGEAQFKLMKRLASKADTADFEKRAKEEFPHLVGTSKDLGLLLKARDGMDEPTGAAFDAVMKAAESMSKAGFENIGSRYPGETPETKKAVGDFKAKVAEIAKRDGCNETVATRKARKEFPKEFEAAYPAG